MITRNMAHVPFPRHCYGNTACRTSIGGSHGRLSYGGFWKGDGWRTTTPGSISMGALKGSGNHQGNPFSLTTGHELCLYRFWLEKGRLEMLQTEAVEGTTLEMIAIREYFGFFLP